MPKSTDPRFYTNELLSEGLVPAAGARVLALGVAAQVVAGWAAAVGPTGLVVAVEHWLPGWRALEVERERTPELPLRTLFTATLPDDATDFDVVAVDITSYPSNRALLAIVHSGAERLKPAGLLYAAGPKDAGILSFTHRMERLLGNAEPQAYRKGQRIVVARRTGEVTPLALEDESPTFTLAIGDQQFEMVRAPGVFAKGALDPATEMLIDALVIKAGDRVLDLGCGAGIVGMVAARRAADVQVTMTDADAYALDAARANCAHNGITAAIHAADVVDAIAKQRFTVVACNPPFHQRHESSGELGLRFMRAAHGALSPGGRAYFVANRFLAYESKLKELFGEVTEVAGDDRYKVLAVTKKAPAGG
ncbi:MAG: class I SAM-dependent methyltransferase [Ktedonobacterales bacterium]|nr:class I SAM-dependent methyltransferase [Ktedonobacterales bacterium]